MERRGFFRNVTATAAAAASLGALGNASSAVVKAADLRSFRDDLASLEGDEAAYWARVRQEFMLSPGLIHLNCGTLGAVPRRVIEAVSGWMFEIEGDPASNVFGPLGYRMEDVRKKAAEFLGAQLDEVALIENTTSGMNAIAEGLAGTLRPGDEILTTDHEHPGGLVCWEYLAKHHGARIVKVPMPAPVEGKEQVLDLISKALTPRTRVCSFSHVETITGLRMPLAEISALVRPRGILLVVDGAQAPGMLEIDVKALGADAYASSSHKWMLAPKGCGLLYIRKEAQERIRPLVLSTGYSAYSAASGTRNVAQILGHGLCMDFHNAIGRRRVQGRCLALNSYLRKRFAEIGPLRLLTPVQEELSSGISTYSLTRGKNGEVYQKLHDEHQIAVKVAAKPEYNALRFSTHIFNSEQQIDRAAEILGKMLKA